MLNIANVFIASCITRKTSDIFLVRKILHGSRIRKKTNEQEISNLLSQKFTFSYFDLLVVCFIILMFSVASIICFHLR